MKLLGLILALLLTLNYAKAENSDLELEYRYSTIGNDLIAQVDDTQDAPVAQEKSLFRAKYRDGKSPLIAAGLSFLIPGAGEVYGEAYYRAGAFLALEGALLGTWYSYEKDGDDKTDDFRAYADTHFSEKDYFTGINYFLMHHDSTDHYSFDGDYASEIRSNWKSITSDMNEYMGLKEFDSHELPSTQTQQYYEMIGKYHQFSLGWDDFNGYVRDDNGDIIDITQTEGNIKGLYEEDSEGNVIINFSMKEGGSYLFDSKAKRDHYETMRKKANDAYETGQSFLMVAIVNHVVSAFHAAYVIKSDWAINSNINIQKADSKADLGLNNFKVEYTYNF